jgi:hypothetical protein
MILGNVDKFKGIGLVAFLDILGFSKEIETNWDTIENNPLEKILDLKENLPLHTNFETDPKFSESKTHRQYLCRVQTISDSIVVSFGFDEPLKMGDILLGMSVFLGTITAIWRNCLAAGFTLRGAADFGSIYWNEKEIIGPSFITAYNLEQTHAKTSRVVISSQLNRNMTRMFFQQNRLWDEMIFGVLKRDIDGILIIDPHTLYSNDEEKAALISGIEALRDSAKGLLKEKYTPLLACLYSEKQRFVAADLGKY